ncbi:MAG: hypothetical protein H0T54_07490 [Geodermatophilaceae bacterium]|nr:hypothetical protein [Geodermatophilaceae bacterium]
MSIVTLQSQSGIRGRLGLRFFNTNKADDAALHNLKMEAIQSELLRLVVEIQIRRLCEGRTRIQALDDAELRRVVDAAQKELERRK